MNKINNINIKAIIVGIIVAIISNILISIVMFSGFGSLLSDDAISIKMILFTLISMFISSSIPAYITAIIAKEKIIFHSIILGGCFVFLNLLSLIFESESIGLIMGSFFLIGIFLFSVLGGVIRKIETEKILKKEIKSI